MIHQLDLSDETGRESVKNIVGYLLAQNSCDERLIQSLIEICEKLIPTSHTRLQFYVDIVENIVHPIDVDAYPLNGNNMNRNTEILVESLKAKLFELKDKETRCLDMDDDLAAIREEILLLKEQLIFLIIPLLPSKTVRIFFLCFFFILLGVHRLFFKSLKLSSREIHCGATEFLKLFLVCQIFGSDFHLDL